MQARELKRLAVIVLVLLVTLVSWLKPMTDLANENVDAGLKRSLISFASARALNGAISVLQGTEVAVQPVGVGVSLSVGEILDPINDLVESLSSVMLMASVAFGIEKLLLSIGANWAVSAVVTGVALLWCVLFLARSAPVWLTRLMLALMFVRFVMPLTMIGSAYAFEHFSANEYQQSQAALDDTAFTLQDVALEEVGKDAAPASPATSPPAPDAASSGLMNWARDKMASAQQQAESALSGLADPTAAVSRKFEALKAAAESTAERIIRLIVVFLMQTVVVPLVLLWALYRMTVGLRLSGAPRGLSSSAYA